MKISFIQVPYNFGFEEKRIGVGAGPVRFLEAGIDKSLAGKGFETRVSDVSQSESFNKNEPNPIIKVNAALAKTIRHETEKGSLPIVLAGGCSTCLGVLAGLDTTDLGVIWFDAHGDFNTPETTLTGFFDGMPLAIVAGRCYEQLRQNIGLQHPILDELILLLGICDLDPEEKENLNTSKISVIGGEALKNIDRLNPFHQMIKKLRAKVKKVYVHFDLDVLDPSEAPATHYPSPDGLALTDALRLIEMIGEHFEISAVTITAYDPNLDENEKTLHSGQKVIERIAKCTIRS